MASQKIMLHGMIRTQQVNSESVRLTSWYECKAICVLEGVIGRA